MCPPPCHRGAGASKRQRSVWGCTFRVLRARRICRSVLRGANPFGANVYVNLKFEHDISSLGNVPVVSVVLLLLLYHVIGGDGGGGGSTVTEIGQRLSRGYRRRGGM